MINIELELDNCNWKHLSVETIAILICKQINFHLIMKLPTNYSLINHMYIHLNVWKEMTDFKLLQLHHNNWHHLIIIIMSCRQHGYPFHFRANTLGKGMNLLILLAMG